MKTLKELAEYLEQINFMISYEEWVTLVNNLNEGEIYNLRIFDDIIDEDLAEKLDTSNIPALKPLINKMWDNLAENFELGKPDDHSAIISPKEDGGVYTESCQTIDFDFGSIEKYMDTECYLELRIDFRPPISAYFVLIPYTKQWNEPHFKGLLGDYRYFHFNIDESDFSIENPTIENNQKYAK